MVLPEEWIKTSRVRTPTGPGIRVWVEGPMKRKEVRRDVSSVEVIIQRESNCEGSPYVAKRAIQYTDRDKPARTTFSDRYPSAEVALDRQVGTLHSYLTSRVRQQGKRHLIETGSYFEGGRTGDMLRKVLAVSGGMVFWCDSAGQGSCYDTNFASWMKRPCPRPDPERVRRIEMALAESSVSEGDLRAASALYDSIMAASLDTDDDTVGKVEEHAPVEPPSRR